MRWPDWQWHIGLLFLLYVTVVAVVLGLRGSPSKLWVAAVFGTLFILWFNRYRRRLG